ncbi:hypothetical protein MP638_001092 [Amoeboaphelidium occidentale]|nr:hypothetical protein MP638_001092 [Amoeboaphelidium occidentale]
MNRINFDLVENSTLFLNPIQLREVDMRENNLLEIENVSILKSKYNPSCIDLSHNSIKELSGFQQQQQQLYFNSLRMLNLSFNSISSIQKDLGLYLSELDTLLLDENLLINFKDFMDGLKSLKKLKYLSLLGNEVRNRRDYKEKMLEGLQGNLRYLDYEKVKRG